MRPCKRCGFIFIEKLNCVMMNRVFQLSTDGSKTPCHIASLSSSKNED